MAKQTKTKTKTKTVRYVVEWRFNARDARARGLVESSWYAAQVPHESQWLKASRHLRECAEAWPAHVFRLVRVTETREVLR